MPRRLGSLPLHSGDKVVLSENGNEKTAKVTRAQKHKAVAKGKHGKTVVTLTSDDGETTLRVDVEEKDAEGRVRLDD